MSNTFVCHECKQEKTNTDTFTTGYGQDKEGNKVCFECCGKQDEAELRAMKPGDKTILYWTEKDSELTNWPGSLKIKVYYFTKSRHNFGGWKTHIWFRYGGNEFYAYQIGDYTQIAHVRRIKNKT
jgi:hypothetical protein